MLIRIDGFPYLPLKTDISLKFNPFLKPEPNAFENASLAANLLEKDDREEFLHYINHSTNYNPHIMFIAKSNIANQWFNTLFPWLFRCEKIFGFKNIKGYDTQRLYAYLAERYLSFWFNKHTKSLNWPWLRFNPN